MQQEVRYKYQWNALQSIALYTFSHANKAWPWTYHRMRMHLHPTPCTTFSPYASMHKAGGLGQEIRGCGATEYPSSNRSEMCVYKGSQSFSQKEPTISESFFG